MRSLERHSFVVVLFRSQVVSLDSMKAAWGQGTISVVACISIISQVRPGVPYIPEYCGRLVRMVEKWDESCLLLRRAVNHDHFRRLQSWSKRH